jgi:preprotein translocase subunit YajC
MAGIARGGRSPWDRDTSRFVQGLFPFGGFFGRGRLGQWGHESRAAIRVFRRRDVLPGSTREGDFGVTPSSFVALLLLAEGEAAAVNPLGGIMQLALPVVMIFFMYVMLIQRPQKREQEQRKVMLSALKKNDHVLLSSGIYGVVTNVREDADEVTVRVDETSNAKLRVTRSAIAKVISDEPADAAIESK